jgi:glycosyltransferase involved in cell wall biosynthesis
LQNSLHSRHLVRSEADSDIYDAMNKGLELSNGEIIGFLNADDFFPSSVVLLKVAKIFEDKKIVACYGDLCFVSKNSFNKIVRFW